jgi:hypothetical protein
LQNNLSWENYKENSSQYANTDFAFNDLIISLKCKHELIENDILQSLALNELYLSKNIYIANAQNEIFFKLELEKR